MGHSPLLKAPSSYFLSRAAASLTLLFQLATSLAQCILFLEHISFEIGYYIPELGILHCVILSLAGKNIHSYVLLNFKLVFPDTAISELRPGHKVPG